MVEVIPVILTNNPQELKRLVSQAEEIVERIQIDIVDGQFASNKTVDPSIFETIETNLNLDFHLMTKEPADWVEKATRAMADRIIGQIEMMENQIEFVEKVMVTNASVGLAVDIKTPISDIDPVVLASLDVVLVMSVPAGFGGQKFDKRALEKIKELNEARKKDNMTFKICVDGGITKEVISSLIKAGTDEVAIGRWLFKGDLRKNIDKIKERII
ncbi:MAG: hypothetical protein WBD86_03805 [Microgenomates group bacterium]